MTDDLRAAADAALIASMPPGLKAAIDAALANGRTRRDVLRFVRLKGGGRNLTTLAVEAYLGCDQKGRAPRA